MEEIRVDMRNRDAYELETYAKHEELVFNLHSRINMTRSAMLLREPHIYQPAC